MLPVLAVTARAFGGAATANYAGAFWKLTNTSHLAPPGAGNDGAVGITAVSPVWLRFDWDAGSPGLENAIGTARFGVYKGNGRLIYQRETF